MLFPTILACSLFLFTSTSGQVTADYPTAPADTPVFAVSVYPNPVRSMIKLRIEGTSANEDILFILFGPGDTEVYQKNVRTVGKNTVKKIPRPGVNAGVYFYRVVRTSTSQVVSGRLVFM